MQPLVSVIVPVFKAEDYLARCLDSLCKQTLREIEIVLVVDGSPDRCGEICDDYAAKDKRFRVIRHQKNKGLSAARNTGIKEARADYLMFVDSDDYVHEDFCRLPYERAVRNHADLVMFGYQRVCNHIISDNKKTRLQNLDVDLLKSGYKTKCEALDLILWTWVGFAAWKKLYHKDLFNNISYPVGYLYEDVGTTYKTVLQASCIYYLDVALYYKCDRDGSISTLSTKKALQDRFAMALQQYRDLLSWGEYPSHKLDLFIVNDAMTYCIIKSEIFRIKIMLFVQTNCCHANNCQSILLGNENYCYCYLNIARFCSNISVY